MVTGAFRLRKALLAASVIVLGFVIGGFLCPLTAVQNVILKANTGYLVMFLLPVVFAVLMGRVFCGSVCPFGALQELLHVRSISRRLPQAWRRGLRVVQWLLLAYLVVHVLVTRTLSFDELTPFRAFFARTGTVGAWSISILFAALSLVLYRPFCRLCPLGRFLGWVSRVRRIGPASGRDCVKCTRCDAACRFDAIENGHVRASDCLVCGDCLSACPLGCLSLSRKPEAPRGS